MNIIKLIFLSATLAIFGCSKCENTESNLPVAGEAFEAGKVAEPIFSKLKNTVWVPVFIEGQTSDIQTPKDGAKFRAFVCFDENCRANGNAGVNLFGGNPSITKSGNFNAGGFFSTRMAGPDGNYERLFLNAFTADFIRVSPDKLELFKDGKKLAEFKRASAADILSKR